MVPHALCEKHDCAKCGKLAKYYRVKKRLEYNGMRLTPYEQLSAEANHSAGRQDSPSWWCIGTSASAAAATRRSSQRPRLRA